MRYYLRLWGRIIARDCIWFVAFNVLVVLWVYFIQWLQPDLTSMFWKSMAVVGIGLAGVIARDMAHAILPSFDDKEF